MRIRNLAILILPILMGCSKKKVTDICSDTAMNISASKMEGEDKVCNHRIKKNKGLITQVRQQYLGTPVGFKLRGHSESKDDSRKSELFIYEGTLNFASIIKFYKGELELGGWIYSDLSTKKEGLLAAEKNSLLTVISIRPIKENSSNVYLFVQNGQTEQPANLDNLFNLDKINGKSKSWQ